MTESEKLIFDIHKIVGEIHTKISLTENEVKHISEKVNEHHGDISILKEHKDNWIGKVSVLSTIIGAVFSSIGYFIAKHF